MDWLIPGAGVVLHRRARPAAGERENPLPARVRDMLVLGEEARITLDIGDPEGHPLTFSMPLRTARRNGLAPGEAGTVSLLREALHLMPKQGAA